MGHFVTPADVARWRPTATSDLFKLLPEFELRRLDSIPDLVLVSRRTARFPDAVHDAVACSPAIWVNGLHLEGATASEIDGLVNPAEIVGIEAYTDASVPAQYRPSGEFAGNYGSCGSIVIWTK